MATDQLFSGLSTELAQTIAHLKSESEQLQARNQQLEFNLRALTRLESSASQLAFRTNAHEHLSEVVAAAVRVAGYDVGVLMKVDPGDTQLTARAMYRKVADGGSSNHANTFSGSAEASNSATPLPNTSLNIGAGIVGRCVRFREALVLNDIDTDSRFSREELQAESGLLGFQPGSLACVPVMIRDDVVGALVIATQHPRREIDALALEVLHALAAHTANIIGLTELGERLRHEHHRLIQTREEERKRIGRDLHDGPAQKLAQIAISIEYAQLLARQDPAKVADELTAIHDLALSTSSDIRNFLFDLRPLVLDAETGGLVAAVRHFLERFHNVPGPKVHF